MLYKRNRGHSRRSSRRRALDDHEKILELEDRFDEFDRQATSTVIDVERLKRKTDDLPDTNRNRKTDPYINVKENELYIDREDSKQSEFFLQWLANSQVMNQGIIVQVYLASESNSFIIKLDSSSDTRLLDHCLRFIQEQMKYRSINDRLD
jgi:hypothetical protein